MENKSSSMLTTGAKGFFVFLFIGVLLISFVAVNRIRSIDHRSHDSALPSVARAIALALYSYAQDHGGKYPEGNSSTEVFQKLLDGKYVDYSDTFYSTSSDHGTEAKRLKPEKVRWDVTCCIDGNSSDDIPVVFRTGFKITYVAGASATPLSGWWSYLMGEDADGIAVTYKTMVTKFLNANPDGSIPNFIPADFDPKGKTYRQLTPNGELKP